MSTEPVPDKDDPKWVCPACGGDGLEGLAWVDLETDQVIDWADPSDYWCPQCEEHFATVCQVNRDGHCHIHDQPVADCRAEYGRGPGGAREQFCDDASGEVP